MASFVIRDVRLFDGETVTENTSVLVKDGLIAEVGNISDAAGLPVISKPGHTLLPGLIDAHAHPEEEASHPEQALRFGVTTVMDMHNSHGAAMLQKRRAKERKDFPDIKSCHYAATIKNGWPAWVEREKNIHNEKPNFELWPNVETEEDAEPYIKKSIEDGVDYIKLMHESGKTLGIEGKITQTPESVQVAVVGAAHNCGLKVVAHALSLKDTIEVLRAGVDGLTHTFYDQPITTEVIDLYKRQNIWLNPTLATIGSLTGEGRDLLISFSTDERITSKIAAGQKQLLLDGLNMASSNARWEYAIDSVRQLKDAGIDILCGSDAPPRTPGMVSGASLHIELYVFVNMVKMSTLEALRSVTSVTARCFEFHDRGRIAPGLKADLILVEGNPLDNITDTLNIRDIWRDGVRFEGHSGFPHN